MHTVEWESPFKWVKVSNYAGIISLILAVFLPILVFIPFYFIRREKWFTEAFLRNYGAFLEGTRNYQEEKKKNSWVSLFVPIV